MYYLQLDRKRTKISIVLPVLTNVPCSQLVVHRIGEVFCCTILIGILQTTKDNVKPVQVNFFYSIIFEKDAWLLLFSFFFQKRVDFFNAFKLTKMISWLPCISRIIVIQTAILCACHNVHFWDETARIESGRTFSLENLEKNFFKNFQCSSNSKSNSWAADPRNNWDSGF